MTVSEIREIALQLNGVTEDIKWEDHLCFSGEIKCFWSPALTYFLHLHRSKYPKSASQKR